MGDGVGPAPSCAPKGVSFGQDARGPPRVGSLPISRDFFVRDILEFEGDFSARDQAPCGPAPAAGARLGSGGPRGASGAGRGRGAGRSRQIPVPAARRGSIARALGRLVVPSLPASAAQCAGVAGGFPLATAGAAARWSAALRHGGLRGAGSAGLRGAPQPRYLPAGRLGARAAAAHARRPAGPHRAGAVRGRAQRAAAAALSAAALPGTGRGRARAGAGRAGCGAWAPSPGVRIGVGQERGSFPRRVL